MSATGGKGLSAIVNAEQPVSAIGFPKAARRQCPQLRTSLGARRRAHERRVLGTPLDVLNGDNWGA